MPGTTSRRRSARPAPDSVDVALNALWSEADLQAYVMRTARMLGYLTYHTRFSISSNPGFPDLVLVKAPRVIIAELKDPKRKVTESHFNKKGQWIIGQDTWLAALEKCPGVETYLWRPANAHEIAEILRGG